MTVWIKAERKQEEEATGFREARGHIKGHNQKKTQESQSGGPINNNHSIEKTRNSFWKDCWLSRSSPIESPHSLCCSKFLCASVFFFKKKTAAISRFRNVSLICYLSCWHTNCNYSSSVTRVTSCRVIGKKRRLTQKKRFYYTTDINRYLEWHKIE